ncbi:hypothetical protein [Corallococcus sp. 4LFB]|uniref:hypothetical protein n=1 Tax=Corallococcus sp. 4LFB TaxID=3383249 RepID=UPI0039763297
MRQRAGVKNRLVDSFRRIAPLSDEEAQAILDSMGVKTCQLASDIRVKPESLSRIRKRIATRGKPATPRRRA